MKKSLYALPLVFLRHPRLRACSLWITSQNLICYLIGSITSIYIGCYFSWMVISLTKLNYKFINMINGRFLTFTAQQAIIHKRFPTCLIKACNYQIPQKLNCFCHFRLSINHRMIHKNCTWVWCADIYLMIELICYTAVVLWFEFIISYIFQLYCWCILAGATKADTQRKKLSPWSDQVHIGFGCDSCGVNF